MEIWKTIEGTENHYEVSNLGNFKLDGKPIDTVRVKKWIIIFI